MSSQNVWDILGGDTAYNQTFEPVGEPLEDEDGLYVEIAFASKEEKTERKAGEKTEAVAQEVEGDFEEEEV